MKNKVKITTALIMTVLAIVVIITTFAKQSITYSHAEQYNVCPGDSLWTIAESYKPGDVKIRDYMWEIEKSNPNVNFYNLQPGDIVMLPVE